MHVDCREHRDLSLSTRKYRNTVTMDYSYTQTHQEDQQQHHHQQSFDPSRIQSYDQSYQAYYPYNHPQQSDHQQQYQQYYNPTTTTQDYATSHDATAHHHQYHQEPISIHPPGVPIPPQQPQTADPDPTHLQNAYYPHGVAEDQKQQVDSSSGYGGLNPAAVAALSQLSQLTGNIEAAQRAAEPPIGQTIYRGGGRRGNRPFRGGGRGHFGYHGSRPDGSAPPFRGRGRGQGGGRHFQQYGAASTNPNSIPVPAEGVAALTQPPSALVPGQAPLPVPTQVSSASFWRPPRMVWCELCRVDCNTPEILEQHKNGKRHKKNMLVHEELQKRNKVNTGQQNAQMPNTELKTEVPVRVEGFEEKQPLQENITSGVVTDDSRNETDQKDTGANAEASAEPGNNSSDQFAGRGRGSKRRMRGGRGGKYVRTNDGSRRPVEPPKPKQVPFICELCNVKCESQVVYDSHVNGKKHLATLKRFHGHRALYGDAGLQAVNPPNVNAASTSAAPPVHQVVNDPQALLAQLLMNYVLSQTQAQGIAPPPGAASAAAPAQGTSTGTQNQLDSLIHGAQAMCQDGSQNVVIEQIKSLLQSVQAYSATPAAGNAVVNTGNETSEFEAKEASGLINTTAAAPTNPGTSEQVSGTPSSKECEVAASSDSFVQPQPEGQM
ncbi:uncharacterized protein LOC108868476 [Pyrus x bretschneideri]|uniref:uncharacterized protein LOC108868476 n=1 Tax=Pyrus x bretschneideri TaxID=225117 RepID=UPI00202DC3B2|nr:uncharacterized protein LOC108868476 [Pyrus x bretschneideri]